MRKFIHLITDNFTYKILAVLIAVSDAVYASEAAPRECLIASAISEAYV